VHKKNSRIGMKRKRSGVTDGRRLLDSELPKKQLQLLILGMTGDS
jgi:hypothetical protein